MKVKTEELNEGDLLTQAALAQSQARLSHLISEGENFDVSIFRHEGLPYAYKLAWMVEGNEIDFMLTVTKVAIGKRGGLKTSIVVDRQFTERIEA